MVGTQYNVAGLLGHISPCVERNGGHGRYSVQCSVKSSETKIQQ